MQGVGRALGVPHEEGWPCEVDRAWEPQRRVPGGCVCKGRGGTSGQLRGTGGDTAMGMPEKGTRP